MIATAANAVDLVTFLFLAPLVVSYGVELGPVGSIWTHGGPLLVVAWKTAGLAVAFSLAAGPAVRYRRVILMAASIVGLVGAAMNVNAMVQLRSLFT